MKLLSVKTVFGTAVNSTPSINMDTSIHTGC